MKKTILALLAAASILACEKTWVNDSPIDTAVAASFSNVTANSVTIILTPTSEVASYLVTDPVVADGVNYQGMDAREQLEYIESNAREADAPYQRDYSSLTSTTTYCIGFVARKADGTICSAPTFASFTTSE